MSGYIDPEREQFEAFKALERNQPVEMLNLVRFREQATYPADHPLAGKGLTGAEAYANYGRDSGPVFQCASNEPPRRTFCFADLPSIGSGSGVARLRSWVLPRPVHRRTTRAWPNAVPSTRLQHQPAPLLQRPLQLHRLYRRTAATNTRDRTCHTIGTRHTAKRTATHGHVLGADPGQNVRTGPTRTRHALMAMATTRSLARPSLASCSLGRGMTSTPTFRRPPLVTANGVLLLLPLHFLSPSTPSPSFPSYTSRGVSPQSLL